jgi:hypothetical protein
VTPQERLKQRNRFAKQTKKAERGKLANSRLFDLVLAVWRLHRKKFNPNTKELHYRALASRLLKAVVELDVEMLQEVTDICNQLQDMPRDGRWHHPVEELDHIILTYYRSHDANPKFYELMAWVGERMGWKPDPRGRYSKAEEKMVDNHQRKKLKVPKAKSKPGPTAKN